jgi:hypothetical protein
MVKMLKNILWISAVTAFGISAAGAQLATTTNPVAAVDNIPPAPVTNLQALVASGADARNVVLTWTLSVDDARSFTSVGGVIVPTGDVRGYRVYRQGDDGVEALLTTLSPGVSDYIDNSVVDGLSYIYSVRPFDLDNESDIDVVAGSEGDLARIVVVGGASEVVVETTIKGKMTIDSSLDLTDQAAVDLFSSQFIQQLATLLGIDPSRIVITELAVGSVVVLFEISEPATGVEEPSATVALETLKTEVTAGTNAFDSLGGVLALNDESTSVLVPVETPLDDNGNVILGWFTRQGDTVNFDDFFLFADHFGTSQGDAGYDALYDIIPNGSVDFEDFFRFADDFGKVIANASVINGG